jgi:hypothetical protein
MSVNAAAHAAATLARRRLLMTAQEITPKTRVAGPIPDPLEKPGIRQAPNGIDLNPLEVHKTGRLTAEIKRLSQGLLETDEFFVKLTGWNSVEPKGSYTSPTLQFGPPNLRALNLELSVVAFNLGQKITVEYTVNRTDKTPVTSGELELNVLDLPEDALEKGRILEAQDDGDGTELDLTTDTEDRTLHIVNWPLINVGQPCWVISKGENRDGSPYEKTVFLGFVDKPWKDDTHIEVPVPYSELKELANGSELTIEYKVAFDQVDDETKAHGSMVRKYTVKAAAVEVKPAITAVTDSNNVPVDDKGETTDTTLKLTIKAGAKEELEFFVNDAPKGKFFTDEQGDLTHPQTDLEPGEQILKVVGVVSGLVSNIWTITVQPVQTEAPEIKSVEDTTGNDVPHESITIATTLNLTIQAGKNELLRILVNDDPEGTAFAGSDGVLYYPLENLGLDEQGIQVEGVVSGLKSKIWTVFVKPGPSDGKLKITAAKGPQRKDILQGGATTATTIMLQGTAEPGKSVNVSDVFSVLKTVQSDQHGYWALPLSDLNVHYYHLALSVPDADSPMLWPLAVFADGTPIIESVSELAGNTIPPYGETSKRGLTLRGTGAVAGEINIHELLSGRTFKASKVDAQGRWEETDLIVEEPREYHYVASAPGVGTSKSNLYRVRKVASTK